LETEKTALFGGLLDARNVPRDEKAIRTVTPPTVIRMTSISAPMTVGDPALSCTRPSTQTDRVPARSSTEAASIPFEADPVGRAKPTELPVKPGRDVLNWGTEVPALVKGVGGKGVPSKPVAKRLEPTHARGTVASGLSASRGGGVTTSSGARPSGSAPSRRPGGLVGIVVAVG
jgi:hypothetical protein